MRTFDLTPFYRSTVGFDRLFSLLDSNVGGEARPTRPTTSSAPARTPTASPWRSPASARTTSPSRRRKTPSPSRARRRPRPTEKESEFLYRGIGARAFERRFQLADHVEVKGANLENGLLHIDLVREIPEAMKPRTIAIGNGKCEGQADRSGRCLTSHGQPVT